MKKRFKLGVLALVSAALILSLPCLSQGTKGGSPIPGTTPSLRLGGWVQLFHGPAGHTDFLEAEIKINKGMTRLPLTGAKVTLVDNVLTETRPGTYKGEVHPFKVVPGRRIEIKLGPGPAPYRQFLIAHIAVNNMINWLFPTPDAEIDIGMTRFLIFRWNFAGAVKKTQVRIKDWATKQTVFQEIVTGTSVNVPTNILQPGKTYRIYQMAYDWDFFKLYTGAAPGSKIAMEYAYVLFFKTK